jgi:predicted amidophosphoribosyltransferase
MTTQRSQPSRSQTPVSCPRCGVDVKRDERFCPDCGLHLEGPTEPELHPVLRMDATASNNAIESRSTRKVPAVKRKRPKPKG